MSPAQSHAIAIAAATLNLALAINLTDRELLTLAHKALLDEVSRSPVGPGIGYEGEVMIETLRLATLANMREVVSLLIACEEARKAMQTHNLTTSRV
jgi:hypothetical protein